MEKLTEVIDFVRFKNASSLEDGKSCFFHLRYHGFFFVWCIRNYVVQHQLSLVRGRLWKGTELGSILRAAFCTHPLPYHIRQILELFCIEVENAGEQQEVTKVNIWNTQLISGREISTIWLISAG